jgi:DNA invertase Pin-like site-specific DNA recombinase
MKIGFMRVSTSNQNFGSQRDFLEDYGCDKIFCEKVSGGLDTNQRLELQKCLEFVREGDEVVVTKLDRLARSTLHLTQIASDLDKRGINLVVLQQNIDTKTPTGKLLFNMLSSIAEFELSLRGERVRDGVRKARQNGVKFGRKRKLTDTQITEMMKLREDGVLIRELSEKYGISNDSVYRLMRQNKNP